MICKDNKYGEKKNLVIIKKMSQFLSGQWDEWVTRLIKETM